MKWVMKHEFVSLFLCQVVIVLASLIELFIRGYSELTWTFLVVEAILLLLSFIGMKLKLYILYILASILFIIGAILLICFPSYISFTVLILASLSLVGETGLLIRSLLKK
ncbi:MAG: hypothetical protein K5762_03535 [Bacilli bacterium]|nr:hypothetical protein [Bacilli bacterium]